MEKSLKAVLDRLRELADPSIIKQKEEKFGVQTKGALGVYMKDLNAIAKEIGKDNKLAIELFNCGVYEGKLLCSKIFRPAELTEELMEEWVQHFDNWEICDSFSMKFFTSSAFVDQKIEEWTRRSATFEKRSGFVMIAAYSSVFKKAENEVFEAFYPIIEREAHDNRLYVKKAVNWALRSIGKRNIDLNKSAIGLAKKLLNRPEASAKWIAKDALKELEKSGLSIGGYPRNQYQRMKKN